MKWPPDIPGLETPEFLVTVRGDFPPQPVVDAEVAEWRAENALALVMAESVQTKPKRGQRRTA